MKTLRVYMYTFMGLDLHISPCVEIFIVSLAILQQTLRPYVHVAITGEGAKFNTSLSPEGWGPQA